MAKPTTNKTAFPLIYVGLRCPTCNVLLAVRGVGLKATFTHSNNNGCPFDGRTFKAPVVYLEEVK